MSFLYLYTAGLTNGHTCVLFIVSLANNYQLHNSLFRLGD